MRWNELVTPSRRGRSWMVGNARVAVVGGADAESSRGIMGRDVIPHKPARGEQGRWSYRWRSASIGDVIARWGGRANKVCRIVSECRGRRRAVCDENYIYTLYVSVCTRLHPPRLPRYLIHAFWHCIRSWAQEYWLGRLVSWFVITLCQYLFMVVLSGNSIRWSSGRACGWAGDSRAE